MAFPSLLVSWPKARALIAVALLALPAAGCLKKGPAEVTGSIPAGSPEAVRREAQALAARFEANPADAAAAMAYAGALRTSGQHAQAVAVLQQAAIRSPKHLALLAAYGKALADVGRYKEAAEVLGRAHLPEKPDWRILSAQGAVADQLGDHALAQRYYEAALKIVPGEPTVLSNLGLSLALSKRLAEAEAA
ncbi:MAG TPA: tetratricopeptide repeat protein, partial [Beijerinckiaceae bacterium]